MVSTTWAQSRTTCRNGRKKDTEEKGKFSLRFVGMITSMCCGKMRIRRYRSVGKIAMALSFESVQNSL